MQKNAFDYTVTLQVRHPTMTAAELSALVGMEPRFSWTVGDKRVNGRGRVLEGLRDESYCAFEVGKGSHGDLARCLQAAVAGLAGRENELHSLRSSGGELLLLAYWHSEGDEGETFDPDLLGTMSKLGISFGLNVLALGEVRAET